MTSTLLGSYMPKYCRRHTKDVGYANCYAIYYSKLFCVHEVLWAKKLKALITSDNLIDNEINVCH